MLKKILNILTSAGIVALVCASGVIAADTLINGSLLPTADNTYNLGSPDKEWKNLYVDGSAYIDFFKSSLIPAKDDTFNIGHPDYEWKNLYVDGSAYIDFFNHSLIPGNDNTYRIGNSDYRWKELYVEEAIRGNSSGNVIIRLGN